MSTGSNPGEPRRIESLLLGALLAAILVACGQEVPEDRGQDLLTAVSYTHLTLPTKA